jgi:hypothetical protein
MFAFDLSVFPFGAFQMSLKNQQSVLLRCGELFSLVNSAHESRENDE